MLASENEYSLSSLLPPDALQLLPGSGAGLIQQVGIDIIRDIIFDVLIGKNIRDSTEALTRSRITALNMAMVSLFLKGSNKSPDFIQQIPRIAANILGRRGTSRSERMLARWLLGLTDKGVQNILRDDRTAYQNYSDLYIQICQETIDKYRDEFGELTGEITVGTESATVNWLFISYLLNAIGAQTLTIRGSNKAAIGKLFEKLILGTLLSILGFTYQPVYQMDEKVFWLSSRDEHRESDATLIYQLGKGVRFDIGFIGRGNSEITLDKVTRYQHEQNLRGVHFYMATIIIVDRIGARSNIVELARQINGSIIQMSAAYWPQQVALLLRDLFGYEHELIDMPQNQIESYLRDKLNLVPLENFIGNLPLENPSEIQQNSLFPQKSDEAETHQAEVIDDDF